MKELRRQIEAYVPTDAREAQDKEGMLYALEHLETPLSRENPIAHFSASAWIVNPARDRVLMAWHNIYRTWSWTGGHADGEADLLSVALREAREETGLAEIAPVLKPEQIVVSIAVGLTIESYEAVLGGDKKIVRAMPNTPAAVQAGVTAFTFGSNVSEDEKDAVLSLFSLAGGTVILPERLMNAVSALTGSGPAYVYMFIEAMADGGCCRKDAGVCG